jgi:hypothetical protein
MRATISLALSFLFAGALSAQTEPRPFLFKDARSELAAARARGDSSAVLVIASATGRNAAVARLIGDMGGRVQFRHDEVDYLRARVPVERVEELAAHPSVHSVSISVTPRRQGGGGGGADNTISPTDTTRKREWPRELLSWYPITNRYDPVKDMRGLEFRRENPTYDGRGVTLAMIDMSMDPLLPELQHALTLDGKPVPKIAGYETVVDAEEEPDGRWLAMEDRVTATGGSFEYRERTYTAPRDGNFRIELLDEAVFDSLSNNGLNKDLNRDGNPEGSSRLFAVLWDDRTNDVWVDTDQDDSFADEKALTDYRTRPEFGVFGTDDPVTAVRESVGFAIQIDEENERVALNIGAASHATLVVGAALASRGEKGRFDGVAPGAQLVNVAEGCAAYGQTEAVIVALANPNVDVAWLEHCSNITRPYTLRDGRMATTVIYDRLIAKYNKPIMVPTHNYPILGGTDDIVMAAGAIGVGAHEGKENFFINHGVRVEHDDNLLITGGYGPMGNGAFGPDIIAPSNYISTALGWQETRPIAGNLYRLPPGYTIAGGTSTATPTATGAVALLISAARQEGIRHDPFRLKHAIVSSARYVPHIPAYKQGSGVVNIAGAWEILKALNDVEPVTITTRAPVRHPFSHTLPTPHEGVGLYERGGWTAGQSGERTVTFTRTSGPREPMNFLLKWVGNEHGTFESPASVSLPLNQPVAVRIGIAPDSAGAQTAILNLENPTIPGVSHRMLAVIVAGTPLLADNDFTSKIETEVPRPEMRSFFYDVAEGTDALRVDIQQRRAVAVALVAPDTRTASAQQSAGGGGGGGGGGFGGGGGQRTVTYTVADPMPGVWEVRLSDLADVQQFDAMQAEKDEAVPPTPVTLTVSALGVDRVGGERVDVDGGAEPAAAVSLVNRMAEFTGALSGMPLGAARRDQGTIRNGEQRFFEIQVPEGTSALHVRVSDVADAAADLDLYVIDCTGDECRGTQSDGDPTGDEIVTISNPSKGLWKVVIDAASVPAGSTTFAYIDVLFNPSFGAVATADVSAERKRDAEWSAAANTWLAGALPEGREPFAGLMLQGRQGSANFDIKLIEVGVR